MGKKNNTRPIPKAFGTKKDPCEKYGLAITNYVLSEDMGMTKEELFEHLKGCKNCRKDLTEWRDTVTVMRMETFSKTQEGKAKMHQDLTKLKERIKTEVVEPSVPTTLPPPINSEKIVGTAAGQIYNCLKGNGPMPIPVLKVKTKLEDYPFYGAMGWLDREGKIIVRGIGNQPQFAELRPER
ncbi:MAG: winged helix-turn-helix domain-containing protein [Planctomycetota bacterium]|nr:winged helix-turn-helix domain-containing protein [Planctomycetota bacterium]